MFVVNQGYEIMSDISPKGYQNMVEKIELCGRTCYKSEGLIKPGSAEKMARGLIRSGHEAMIEHESITVKFICDRGISHEIVRHRLASFAQESTRYCNYNNGKFKGQITVINPFTVEKADEKAYELWLKNCNDAEANYLELLDMGVKAETARSVLPTCVKTELVVTMNIREWRWFFKLRTVGESGAPHPQIEALTRPLLEEFAEAMPALFADLLGD